MGIGLAARAPDRYPGAPATGRLPNHENPGRYPARGFLLPKQQHRRGQTACIDIASTTKNRDLASGNARSSEHYDRITRDDNFWR